MKKIKELYLKYEEIINYLIFGVLTTVVSVITYYIFANFLFQEKNDITVQISNVLSWICAVIFAYTTNRKFVFKSKSTGKAKLKEIFNFFIARVSSLVIDMAMMFVLFSVMHIDDTISKIIVQFVVVIVNYVFSKLFVFKKENIVTD